MNDLTTKLNAMRIAFDLSFRDVFAKKNVSIHDQFAMTVGDAAHTSVELPFLEQFGAMRKWLGPRQIRNLSGKTLTLKEDSFENTVAIKRRTVETDNWGVFMPAIRQMAIESAILWDKLATEALVNPGNWIDGKAFFATDRKYGKQTINNKTTSALSSATYGTGRTAIMSYCGHDGEPLCVVPDTLMVGPALESTARKILENEFVSDGTTTTSNEYKGTAKLLVNPRLVGSAANYWFLMSTEGAFKPVAVQKSKEGELVSKDKPEDDNVFMEDAYYFGSNAYGSAAAAFPHLVYGGIVA